MSYLAHVGGAAMNRHCAVGDAADHFRAEHLAARSFKGDVLASRMTAGGVQHHCLGRVTFGLAVSEHRLQQLQFANRTPELFPLPGMGERLSDQPAGGANAQRGYMNPACQEPSSRS